MEKKYVDFDYQRYLDGDEVFYRDGSAFEGDIFKSKKIINCIFPLIAIHNPGQLLFSHSINGAYNKDGAASSYDLVMLPKKKTLYISISKEPLDRKDCQFIQVEIDE